MCFALSKCDKLYIYSLRTTPPLYQSSLPISGSVLRADWPTGLLFVGDSNSDKLSILALENMSKQTEIHVSVVATLTVGKQLSAVYFWKERNEIYLGYTSGVVAVVAMRLNPPTLVCRCCSYTQMRAVTKTQP